MAKTVADYVLERLRDWGVEHVFGYAGDGINGLLAAWGRADDDPRFIQASRRTGNEDAALALVKGDADRWALIKEGLKTKAQELLPSGDG